MSSFQAELGIQCCLKCQSDNYHHSYVRGQAEGVIRVKHHWLGHTDLKSQMRSKCCNNGSIRPMDQGSHIPSRGMETKESVALGEAGRANGPERKIWRERKRLLPTATHQHITPVTSYTPHFIWNAVARRELNGIADAFLHVCWLCLVTCSASLSSSETQPAGRT